MSTTEKAPVTIDPVCGNCCHWAKSSVDLLQGVCVALPPTCSFKGNALIKCRPNMAANERGCTGLFMPLPELLAGTQTGIKGA